MKFSVLSKKVRQKRQIDRQKFIESSSFVLATLTEKERFQYLNQGTELTKINDPNAFFTALAQECSDDKKILPIAESKVIRDWVFQWED